MRWVRFLPLLLVLVSARPALADPPAAAPCGERGHCPRYVPKGSTLRIVDDPATSEDEREDSLTIPGPVRHYLWPEPWVVEAHAQATGRLDCLVNLKDEKAARRAAEEELAKKSAPPSAWVTGLRITGVSILIVGAFAAGYFVGREAR